jgi:acyl carrier protein
MIFEKLKKIIAEEFGLEEDEVTMDLSFADDLDADSVDIVELSMTLEEEFGVDEIDDDAASSIQTVGDLVHYLQEQLGDV